MRRKGPGIAVCTAAIGACLCALAGCSPKPARTVAEAHERFRAAVAAEDLPALYESLDQESRWSVITIQKYYREVRTAVLEAYPQEARAREFERTAGAEHRRPGDFFAVQAKRRGWFARCAGGDEPASRIEEFGRQALVHTASGKRFPFAFMEQGGWGYAGLRKDLEDLKRQAYHDAETARENARLYKKGGGAPTPSAPPAAGGAAR